MKGPAGWIAGPFLELVAVSRIRFQFRGLFYCEQFLVIEAAQGVLATMWLHRQGIGTESGTNRQGLFRGDLFFLVFVPLAVGGGGLAKQTASN